LKIVEIICDERKMTDSYCPSDSAITILLSTKFYARFRLTITLSTADMVIKVSEDQDEF
jgi:hypothetical protein